GADRDIDVGRIAKRVGLCRATEDALRRKRHAAIAIAGNTLLQLWSAKPAVLALRRRPDRAGLVQARRTGRHEDHDPAVRPLIHTDAGLRAVGADGAGNVVPGPLS